MGSDLRTRFLPVWILLPLVCAGVASVLTVWQTGSLLAGLAAAFISSIFIAWHCERTLRAIIGPIAQIAGGDRYAVLPNRIGGGALAEGAAAAETMRQALIDADALAVDHRSREAEARLHHAGRTFFTQRFRAAVDKLIGLFQSAGEEIRVTTSDLGERNKNMLQRTSVAVEAATSASHDVAAVADAARALLTLIVRTATEAAVAKDAAKRSVDDLARTSRTVHGLAAAAERIGAVVKLIEAIASQTSLLARSTPRSKPRAPARPVRDLPLLLPRLRRWPSKPPRPRARSVRRFMTSSRP